MTVTECLKKEMQRKVRVNICAWHFAFYSQGCIFNPGTEYPKSLFYHKLISVSCPLLSSPSHSTESDGNNSVPLHSFLWYRCKEFKIHTLYVNIPRNQDVKTTDSAERWHLKDCGEDEDHFMTHSPLSTLSSDTVTNKNTADADRTWPYVMRPANLCSGTAALEVEDRLLTKYVNSI